MGEVIEMLGMMMLSSPTFMDKSGYFPEQNLDTVFQALNEGLRLIKGKLGEERYRTLTDMSDRMRALFEADPDDKTGETRAGQMLILEMEDILTSVAKREAAKK